MDLQSIVFRERVDLVGADDEVVQYPDIPALRSHRPGSSAAARHRCGPAQDRPQVGGVGRGCGERGEPPFAASPQQIVAPPGHRSRIASSPDSIQALP